MGAITDQILRKPKPIAEQSQLDAARARNIAAAGQEVPAIEGNNPALSASAQVQTPTDPITPPVSPVQLLGAVRPTPSMIGRAEVQGQGQQEQPSTITPPKPQQKSFLEIFQFLNPAMSPEEEAAERERQKRNEKMTAIGDAIGALANLWGTTKGAVNAYDANTSMSARNRAYWDQLNKERQANKDRYNNLLLQALRMDMDKDRDGFDRDMALRRLLEAKRQYDDDAKRAADKMAYDKDKDKADRQQAADELAARLKIAADDNASRERIAAMNNDADRYRAALAAGDKSRSLYPSPYTLSTGETIKVPITEESIATIAKIYGKLPKEFRKPYETQQKVERDPYTNAEKIVETSLNPDLKDMQSAIGAYLASGAADAPLIDDDLRELAGQKRKNIGYVVPTPEPEPMPDPEEPKKSKKEARKERREERREDRKERKESKNQPAPGSKGKAY